MDIEKTYVIGDAILTDRPHLLLVGVVGSCLDNATQGIAKSISPVKLMDWFYFGSQVRYFNNFGFYFHTEHSVMRDVLNKIDIKSPFPIAAKVLSVQELLDLFHKYKLVYCFPEIIHS